MTLAEVQPGTLLILHGIGFGLRRQLVRIDRTTKTQLITSRGKRFRKKDGHEVGKVGFGSGWLRFPKAGELSEVRNELRHQKLAYDISVACADSKLKKMPLKALERLATVLEEINAETT